MKANFYFMINVLNIDLPYFLVLILKKIGVYRIGSWYNECCT